jgi:hypothetical protein
VTLDEIKAKPRLLSKSPRTSKSKPLRASQIAKDEMGLDRQSLLLPPHVRKSQQVADFRDHHLREDSANAHHRQSILTTSHGFVNFFQQLSYSSPFHRFNLASH